MRALRPAPRAACTVYMVGALPFALSLGPCPCPVPAAADDDAAMHAPMSIMQVFTAGTAVHAMVSMSCLDAKRLVAFSTAWHVSVLSVLVPSAAAAPVQQSSASV